MTFHFLYTNNDYMKLWYENTSTVHVTWPAHLIFLDLIVCALRSTQYTPLRETVY
jgi:hypothetical protein